MAESTIKMVRLEAIKMVKMANDFKDTMQPTDTYPYPNAGETKFYLLSNDGVYTASVREQVLVEGGHKFSPLFYQGQEVISQIRRMAESQETN